MAVHKLELGGDEGLSRKEGRCSLFLEGALEVISEVSGLVAGNEWREIVDCDDDLGALAQERCQPRK